MPFCLAAVTTALWVCISKHPIVYSTTKATKNNSNKTWNEDQEVRFAWMSGTAQGFQGIKTEAGESCSGRAPRIQGTKLPLTSPGHESRSPGGEQGRIPRWPLPAQRAQAVSGYGTRGTGMPRGDGHLPNRRLPGICPKNNGSCRYRIGPTEVENALAEHPAVAESAVVSSPDPARGEVRKTRKVSDWLGVPGKAGGKGNLISPGRRTCAMRSPEGAVGLSPARSGAAGHSMTPGLLFHFYS